MRGDQKLALLFGGGLGLALFLWIGISVSTIFSNAYGDAIFNRVGNRAKVRFRRCRVG